MSYIGYDTLFNLKRMGWHMKNWGALHGISTQLHFFKDDRQFEKQIETIKTVDFARFIRKELYKSLEIIL